MMSFLADGGRPLVMLGTAYIIYLLRTYRQKGSLVDSVVATAMFKCSDPRDHLYSLLSIPEADPHGLKADYSLPIEEVCMQFAKATMVSGQSLKALSLAPHTTFVPGGSPPARLALPSWVPDLSCQGPANPLVSYTIRPQLFHAGGMEEPNVTLSDGGRLLCVRGRVVDKVAAMARCQADVPFPSEEDVHPKSGIHARLIKRAATWFQECCEVAGEKYWKKKPWIAPKQEQQPVREESREETELRRGFLETLLCGMTAMRDPIPDELLEAMKVYVDYLVDYFTEGYEASEEVMETILTYGALLEQSLLGVTESRRFCRTEQGRLGQVRIDAREGDVFVCILGAEVPYLLRPNMKRAGVYTLIGDSFLLGVMQGEALSDARYETIDISIE
jgi:hypothetical protein